MLQQHIVNHETDLIIRVWVTNFSEGLSGEQTLTAVLYAPCEWSAEHGYTSGPCAKKNQNVVMAINSVVIDFE